MRRGLGLATVALAVVVGFLPGAGAAPARAAVDPVAPGVPGEGRAWELVTSSEVVQAQIGFVRAVAASGNRLIYITYGPLPGSPTGSGIYHPNLAERGPNGWVNRALPMPIQKWANGFPEGPALLSPDFDQAITTNNIEVGPESWETGLFLGAPGAPYAELLRARDLGVVGASTDFGRIVVAASGHLLPGDAGRTSGRSFYELTASGLRLVDVANDGSLISECGAYAEAPGVVSRDGRRIFFTAAPGCAGVQRVYMRTDGATTTDISAPQCVLTECGSAAVGFVAAAPDGQRVLIESFGRLTDDDDLAEEGYDLYEYDVASGDLTLLTGPLEGVELARRPSRGSVAFVPGGVYFTAESTATGVTGLYFAGPAGTQRIAAAAEGFFQLSDDNRFLVFSSTEPLLPADADGQIDVYRYDSFTGSVVLASGGGPGRGNGPFDAIVDGDATVRFAPSHGLRAISDDGKRIFFETEEQLLPEDRSEGSDVYEWTSDGLSLISGGSGDQGAMYLNVTPDGRTVFFQTAATLVPRDRDGGEYDIYATRIGGGEPADGPAAPACPGGSCSASAGGRAERPLPASAGSALRISVLRPGPAARRRIAATGRLVLLAEAPQPGRIAAAARVRLGGSWRSAGSTAVELAQAGPVRLEMELSGQARARLAKGRDLRVRVVLRLAGLEEKAAVSFLLRAQR